MVSLRQPCKLMRNKLLRQTRWGLQRGNSREASSPWPEREASRTNSSSSDSSDPVQYKSENEAVRWRANQLTKASVETRLEFVQDKGR